MPQILPITGNGATLALTTLGFVGNWTRIGEWSAELPGLPASHLATTGFEEFIQADLATPGEIELEVQFNPQKALPAQTTVDTLTVTFPKSDSTSTAANLAGTGWLTKIGTPQMVNNEVAIQKFTFKFDGKTGPTYTAETAGSSSSA
jgi:hypothetical protein